MADIGQSAPFIQAVDQLRRMPFVSSLATGYLLEGMASNGKLGDAMVHCQKGLCAKRRDDRLMDDSSNSIAGQDKRGRFLPGNKFAKGRRGSRNKLGEKFLDALLAEWRRSGKRALEKAAGNDPVAFVKVVAGLLPKEIAQTLNVNQNLNMNIEVASFSQAYDAWGKYLGAQPPAKLIEARADDSQIDD